MSDIQDLVVAVVDQRRKDDGEDIPWNSDQYNWRHAFETASNNLAPVEGDNRVSDNVFLLVDVAEVFAASAGESDGRTWMALVALNDGRFAFIEAGCCYTGWG